MDKSEIAGHDDCLIITNDHFLKTYLRSAMNLLETLLLSERERTSKINLEEIVDSCSQIDELYRHGL